MLSQHWSVLWGQKRGYGTGLLNVLVSFAGASRIISVPVYEELGLDIFNKGP